MDFRVSEGQRELAEGIRTMLAGRLPLERIRAREGEEHVIDADDWAALGDTGVFALTLPEPAGTGLALADAAVVFEELGRALVPGPLVGTFLAATRSLVPGRGGGPGHGGSLRQLERRAPWLVEHLSSLDAAFFLPAGGIGGGRSLIPPSATHPPRNGSPRRSTRSRRCGSCPHCRAPEPGRPRPGALPGRRHPHRSAAGGSRRRDAGSRGRLRQGARAVRQADRQLPGHQAPVRRHARARRGGPGRGARGGLPGRRARRAGGGGGGRRDDAVRVAATRRRRRQAAGRRGGDHERPGRHPGARRHGLHLGGAAAPAPQAVPRARHHLRDVGQSSSCSAPLPAPA